MLYHVKSALTRYNVAASSDLVKRSNQTKWLLRRSMQDHVQKNEDKFFNGRSQKQYLANCCLYSNASSTAYVKWHRYG